MKPQGKPVWFCITMYKKISKTLILAFKSKQKSAVVSLLILIWLPIKKLYISKQCSLLTCVYFHKLYDLSRLFDTVKYFEFFVNEKFEKRAVMQFDISIGLE